MTKIEQKARIKYLEDLIAQSFLDEEGQRLCPFGDGICNDCQLKDLCDEAELITEKLSNATGD